MKKIQALHGNWCENPKYYTSTLREINDRKIPIARYIKINCFDHYIDRKTPPSEDDNTILSIDRRSWLMTDSEFDEYIHHLPFGAAICVFEDAFYSNFLKIDKDKFFKKLDQRVKRLHQVINGDFKLISPAITLNALHNKDYLIDFFVQNRNLFDAYALYVDFDFKEQHLVLLGSLLQEVLSILKKPVWIIRWASPSCEVKIEYKQGLEPIAWKPCTHNEAALKMKNVYRNIEEITHGDSKWFYTGIGIDDYSPYKQIPDCWNPPNCLEYADFGSWQPQHFSGLIDYQDNIKVPILNSLAELCKNNSLDGQ